MRNLIAFRKSSLLFNVLLVFSGLTFMLTWLPLLRCLMDGESYSWGQHYFGLFLYSKGLSFDYLALVLFFLLYLGFFSSFYWIKNRFICYAFLLWWWLHNFGNFLYELAIEGDSQFHGETLDVHVSLSTIIIPLAVLAAILVFLVIRKDRMLPEVAIPWGARNRKWLWIVLTPLLLQFPLFALGEPHELTDEIAVMMAILQSFLFPIIFIPEK